MLALAVGSCAGDESPAGDQALADSLVLTAQDLGAGWDVDAVDAEAIECVRHTTENSVHAQLPGEVELSQVSARMLDEVRPDDGAADAISMVLTAGGRDRVVTTAHLSQGSGRALSRVMVTFAQGDVDEDLVAEIWAVVAAKLQAADV